MILVMSFSVWMRLGARHCHCVATSGWFVLSLVPFCFLFSCIQVGVWEQKQNDLPVTLWGGCIFFFLFPQRDVSRHEADSLFSHSLFFFQTPKHVKSVAEFIPLPQLGWTHVGGVISPSRRGRDTASLVSRRCCMLY